MLINVGQTLYLLSGTRFASIMGRMGSGKTALGFALAEALLRTGYGNFRYLISNCSSVWNDDIDAVVPRDEQFLDSIILLDEGGLFLETSRQAKQMLAALRKMNCCIIIPSVMEPSIIAKSLIIRRVFTLMPLGVPLWVYKTELTAVSRNGYDSQYFFWWRPSSIFGVYSTRDFVTDADDIKDWLYHHKQTMIDFVKSKRGAAPKKVATVTPKVNIIPFAASDESIPADDADDFMEAAARMEFSSMDFQVQSDRVIKRLRRRR